ncbi:juvenile hormone acid O-methyltransferase [Nephila pilipes]|uniref:Juvenile hormone acid O-methyltransferase n=1 Tax=Nephila pilipes TaxID=299642 RepID=A0A8X6NND8_NEPPI|nr:juvenile hormone acid O-methyltransferase [Nephila pilipes]
MNLDPKLYSRRHKPVDSVGIFISKILPQLGWGKSDENEVVMDVGCGPGGNAVQLIVPLFPKLEKVFAMDLLPDMIDFAKKHNSHSLIEYSIANIEDWSSIDRWESKISKLVALHCFQWLKVQRKGFYNVFKLLKPGGEAAFCFVLNSSFYAAILEIEKNHKWSSLFEEVDDYVPISHHDNYHASYYAEMLKDIGFEILYCKEEIKMDAFTSDEEYRDFFPSICALTSHVPAEQMEEFKDDLIQELLKQNGRNSEGLPQHWGNMLELVVRKPK